MIRELTMPIDKILPLVAHFESHPSAGVLYLEGNPGIGKTRFVKDFMSTVQRRCCIKILSAMGTEDIMLAGPKPGDNFINFLANKGFPFVGTEDLWVHPESRKPPCLFLDEVNRCVPYMMNAFLQGLTERSIHGIPFIPGTMIVAAGNPSDTGVSRLSHAFANRLTHIYCDVPTLDGFESFCIRNNVNEIIAWYHKQTGGEKLYVHNPDHFLKEQAEPTPRVWAENVGPVLDNTSLSDSDRMILIGGMIGFAHSNDFEVQYRLRKELPDLEAILDGRDQPVPKQVSTKVLAINALVRRSTHGNVGHVFKYISKLASHDPEYADLFEKNLFIKDPTFAGNPAYTKWVLQMNRKPIVNTASQKSQPIDPADEPNYPPLPPVQETISVPPKPAPQSVEDILKSIPTIQPPKRRI